MEINKMIVPANRTHGITYAIRDIILLADEVKKTGKEMLYLNIGDPNVYDFVTPKHIIEAVYHAMLDNKNGYSPSSGIDEARASIERDANKKGINGILDVFITTGASEAIEICLSALLNRGENFLMPSPGYPLYTAVQSKLELEANPYYLSEENDWQPDIDDIRSKINDKTRAIVVINPNNPTGSIASKETLEKIVDIALEYNLLVIADEIYDKLIFDGKKHVSIGSLSNDVSCITFSGLSKNFVAPGFRLGWGVASGRHKVMGNYLEAVNKMLRARVCANHPEQFAVTTALEGDQSHISQMINTLQKRRDITDEMLNSIPGISLVRPQGAFYAFAKVEVENDNKFVSELIKQTGVIVVPGSGFGQKPGTSHFRVVILPQEDILRRAYNLIGEFMTGYKD